MGNEQRVVAILGAGGSLGAAVSRQLAGESPAGLVLSDISASSLEATIEGMPDNAVPTETVLADVSDLQQVEAVVTRALEQFGRLDVLVSTGSIRLWRTRCPYGWRYLTCSPLRVASTASGW